METLFQGQLVAKIAQVNVTTTNIKFIQLFGEKISIPSIQIQIIF